jgi:5'-methylthioadenosine phosphorylase
MFGLITGSGFYDIPDLEDRRVEHIDTAFGPPVAVTFGRWRGSEVCFLPRHGADHIVPPHGINYRANVSALATAGAHSILATAVSGSMRTELPPGSLVLFSDVLNFTSGREDTFFDGSLRAIVAGQPPAKPVVHTDMSDPYSSSLRQQLRAAAATEQVDLHDGAVYCTTDGPRFETPAEIRMLAAAGGDLVGMTGYPEVVLAVEAGLRYASIGVVSNLAAGISADPLSVDDIMGVLDDVTDPLHRLLAATVASP